MFRKLLGLHEHSWEHIETIVVRENYNSTPNCLIYLQKCSVCGKLNKYKVRA